MWVTINLTLHLLLPRRNNTFSLIQRLRSSLCTTDNLYFVWFSVIGMKIWLSHTVSITVLRTLKVWNGYFFLVRPCFDHCSIGNFRRCPMSINFFLTLCYLKVNCDISECWILSFCQVEPLIVLKIAITTLKRTEYPMAPPF